MVAELIRKEQKRGIGQCIELASFSKGRKSTWGGGLKGRKNESVLKCVWFEAYEGIREELELRRHPH